MTKRILIIGSGIALCVAGYLVHRSHSSSTSSATDDRIAESDSSKTDPRRHRMFGLGSVDDPSSTESESAEHHSTHLHGESTPLLNERRAAVTERAAQLYAESQERKYRDGDRTGDLSSEEEQVMVMYDRMADAFEKHAKDCDSMASAIDDLVNDHKPDVEKLAASRFGLSAEDQSYARHRVEAAAEDRLTRIRQNLRVSLASCPDNHELTGAIQRLASLSHR